MSCYTTIYPDWDFKKEYASVDDVISKSKWLEKEIEKHWEKINALAFVSATFADVDEISKRVESLLFDYYNLSESDYHLFVLKEMFDSEADGLAPSVSVNRYAWNYSPSDGMRDNHQKINDCFMQIRAFAVSCPKDVVPVKDDDGYVNDPIDYISNCMKNIRSLLDVALADYFFSKLCVEFWDTHIID